MLFLSGITFAQQKNSLYEEALYDYAREAYSAAYQKFKDFTATLEPANPLNASAQYYTAECLYKLGDYPGAVFEFEKEITYHQLSNFREESLYKLGLIYYNLKQYQKSRERLSTLISTYPENEHYGSALYWIGEAYTVEQKYDEAIEFFNQAIQQKRNNSFLDYSVYTLATIYEKKKEYKKAVEFYDMLLSYYKNSTLAPTAQIRIGYCYYKLKEYENSIIELSSPTVKSLSSEKKGEALYMLGNSYFRTAEYDKAQTTFLELIGKYPDNEYIREIKYSLAWCYFQQKQYQDAYKTFQGISEGSDTLARLSIYWKAECQRYLGNDNEALKGYQEYIKKFPLSPLIQGVQYQVGVIYYNNKMFDKSVNFLNSATNSTDPEIKARSLILLGELELNRMKYAAGYRYFTNALSLKGIQDNLRNRGLLGLGVVQYAMKKYTDALQAFDELDTKAPNFESDKVQFYSAECQFQLDNFQDALSHYKKISFDQPELGAATAYGTAYCYYNLKDFDNASFAFDDFCRKFPRDSRVGDAKIRLADTYLAVKRYADAARVYEESLKLKTIQTNKDYLNYQYALTLFKSGKTQQAVTEFTKMLSTYPKSPYTENSLYMVGWIRFQQGKLQEAVNSYLYLLSYAPHSKLLPLLYYSVGDAYYNMGAYDSAITYYGRVAYNFKNSSYIFDAVNGLQLSYIAKGDLDKASAIIDEFANENKKSNFADQLYYKKGEMYFNQGNYEQAIESYKEFVQRFPASKSVPKALLGIGKASQLLGDKTQAANYFRKVFDAYPGSDEGASAVVEAGNIYTAAGNPDEALRLYDRAIDKVKKETVRPEIMYYKGVTLEAKGDSRGAYDVFEEIVMYYDGTLFADKSRLELGQIELKSKRYPNAAKFLQALSTKRTDDLGAAAQFWLGTMYMEQNKLSDAVTAFVRILNLFGTYEEWVVKANLRLAGCYEQLKDVKKAKEMYKVVISKHKDDEFGKEAAQKLKRLK